MALLYLSLLIACSFAALILQIFLPPLPWLHGAQIQLMPIVMFYGALALPYPLAMVLTFCCGLMWDLLSIQVVDSTVEISLGWSIVIYSILGSMMHGFRPLFLKGTWEIFSLMTGFFTGCILVIEYLVIIFRRHHAIFPSSVWWVTFGAGVTTMLLSPLFYWLFGRLADAIRYDAETPYFEETL